MECEGFHAVRGAARKIALPSMGQEGDPDRILGASAERCYDHAPAGSAGGAPRIGGLRTAGAGPPGFTL